MKVFTVLAALTLAPSVMARLFLVQVGMEVQQARGRGDRREQLERTEAVRFVPNNVRAFPGDVVRFQLFQSDHQISEARVERPCERRRGGFSSGLVRNRVQERVTTWDYLVTDRGPRVFFDEQSQLCGSGRFFTLNGGNGNGNGGFGNGGGFNGNGNGGSNGGSITSSASFSSATGFSNSTQFATAAQSTDNFILPGTAAASVSSNTGTATVASSVTGSASLISTLTNGATVATGTGTTSNGDQCQCQCLCGSDSFGAGQGFGNFGGIGSGPMPSMIGVM